jgi:hypothetical protein
MPNDAELGASLEVCIWFEADPQHHDEIVATFIRLAQVVEAQAASMRLASPAPESRPRLLRRPEVVMRAARPRQIRC